MENNPGGGLCFFPWRRIRIAALGLVCFVAAQAPAEIPGKTHAGPASDEALVPVGSSLQVSSNHVVRHHRFPVRR